MIVLASGGTGGHLFPAEALAAELRRRGRAVALITDRRGDSWTDMPVYQISAGGIAGRGLAARTRAAFALAKGYFQARSLLSKLKPAAAVGFGGYASLPTMLAAAHLRLPTIIHEQNAVLGRANALLAAQVTAIAASFPGKGVLCGNPVRPAILPLRDRPYQPVAEAIHLLVLGGSQGARIFSDIVPPALASLNEDMRRRLRLSQQCRGEDLERVRAAYATAGIAADLATFFKDVPERLGEAHLVICRSGASTVAELTVAGRPALLVPFPFAIDDHQTANARALAEAGGGWLMPQPDFTAAALAAQLEALLGKPAALAEAAAKARQAGHPDAAARLADMVEEAA